METKLPTRLLSFRRLPSQEISVRLEIKPRRKGRYNALSYCWGLSQTCVTTLATLKSHERNIPWTSLSSTFRDAILFSLALGINLLWVDALCIVQDDTNDWESESAKMVDVYQNAFLTLAATASASSHEGCFSTHHRPIREYGLGQHSSSTESSAIFVREAVKHWTVPLTKASAQGFPLLSRGWVLQEGYLSARVVHFGSQELIWECRNETLCECGGLSTPRDEIERLLLTSTEASPAKRVTPKDGQSAMSEQWHIIVERYSALKLSRETDRLPALSGLALKASANLGRYLCGLWQPTLIHDLIWRVPSTLR